MCYLQFYFAMYIYHVTEQTDGFWLGYVWSTFQARLNMQTVLCRQWYFYITCYILCKLMLKVPQPYSISCKIQTNIGKTELVMTIVNMVFIGKTE